MPVDKNLELEEKYRYKVAAALFSQHYIKYWFYSTLEKYYGIKHEEQFFEIKSSFIKRVWLSIKR